MGKNTLFICQNCGTNFTKWQGKCENCNSWGTVLEEKPQTGLSNKLLSPKKKSNVEINSLTYINEDFSRTNSQINEINRLLGGGIVNGSSILISGEPGIGKSTLLIELTNKLASPDAPIYYISGEESLNQIKIRADRLKIKNDNILIANTTSLVDLVQLIKKHKPFMLIIDSIQTIYYEKIDSPPGSISQVRVCAYELMQLCKQNNITLILVGHITKDGQIAGPKILEHMVDVVLTFSGEHTHQYRIIRATKNRYGSTNELAIFEMQNDGLKQVCHPSQLFLPKDDCDRIKIGSCIFPSIEGTRTILLEIQSLVVPTFQANPRRATIGWDHNRLAMIIAVLNARMKLNLANKEVYLNIVGGLKLAETAADLAVIAALISSDQNKAVTPRSILFGEVGLSGEIRQVSHIENRLAEAEKFGMKKAFIPKQRKKVSCKMELIELNHISEMRDKLF